MSRETTASPSSGFASLPTGSWGKPPPGFFGRDAVSLARGLLGCLLTSLVSGEVTSGVIVETEAYTQDDQASHSRCGPTARNHTMFQPGGRAYVYVSYGIHHCFNVTSGPAGRGEAVLIRALEPRAGVELMAQRRGKEGLKELCSGPGKLCQALGITTEHCGGSLREPPLFVLAPHVPFSIRIASTRRIGISRAVDLPRRFTVAGSSFLSR